MNDALSHCAICGLEFQPHGCSTGSAIRAADSRRVCLLCAADDERREIRDAERGETLPMLYLASKPNEAGRSVYRLQSWGGTTLGNAQVWTRRVGFGGQRYYFSGRACGRLVHGTSGGPGMYARVKLDAKQ